MRLFKDTKKKLLLAVFLLTTTSSVFANDMEKINALNKAVADVLNVTEALNELNGEETQQKFFMLAAKSDGSDILDLAGQPVKYPASLKAEYDDATSRVSTIGNQLVQDKLKSSKKEACVTKMKQLDPKFKKLAIEMKKGQALSVTDNESRAKAYFMTVSVISINTLVAELAMSYFSVCSEGVFG